MNEKLETEKLETEKLNKREEEEAFKTLNIKHC